MNHPERASIVTGGGRGIGRAIARRLAREGPVVIVGRTRGDLDSIRDQIVAQGGRAEPCEGDVADPATAIRARDAALARGWVVHNLICNAGIGKSGPTATFDPALWRTIFDVNVHGSFHFIQACLPAMIERQAGAIVLMSSVAGVRGLAFDAAYTATKHALVGLARALALEVGKRGIVVVPVCPGFVESEMTRRAIAGLMERHGISEPEAEAKVAATNPQKRIIPAEEVAEAVALVCSGLVPALGGSPLILGGGL
jgi:3-hydroxybutyrate dehydrogenase